ncbi:Protein of unknown function [Lishizhenia tianjinensis]|uniref:DUF1573 domain-containing protein n=2 Tax=Lishizhenia TaxID=559293 RepID=A0A1I6YTX2_9FLAO|nr:DUF1573 domain-containing protein [Lishizhenia tianjinensis]SFT53886.1 Protein of unknown function [Lishizhenia tianjinensis]
MKKALFTLSLAIAAIFAVNTVVAQEIVDGAKIEFEKTLHDYGTIEHGGNGVYEFVFTNTGNQPLMISNAKGSCGCTVPEWPKEPIAPGATGVIKVKYDTKRAGQFSKSVTLTSNAVNSPTMVIRIKGVVKSPAQGGAPANGTGAPAN